MPTSVIQLKNEQLLFGLAGSVWPATRAGDAGFGLAAGVGLDVSHDQNQLVRDEAGDASCSARVTLVAATRRAAARMGTHRRCFI
jgi:hypothetical protein